MKQKTHYSEALAYLRDYCLRHGRLMHFSVDDIFEAYLRFVGRCGRAFQQPQNTHNKYV